MSKKTSSTAPNIADNRQAKSAEIAASRQSNLSRREARVSEILSDRQGALPVWVRAPKSGHEYFSGTSRAKLYEWDAKGYIRSVSIREPGQVKGCRFFELSSILAFIEKCATDAEQRAREQQASANEAKGGAQ